MSLAQAIGIACAVLGILAVLLLAAISILRACVGPDDPAEDPWQ